MGIGIKKKSNNEPGWSQDSDEHAYPLSEYPSESSNLLTPKLRKSFNLLMQEREDKERRERERVIKVYREEMAKLYDQKILSKERRKIAEKLSDIELIQELKKKGGMEKFKLQEAIREGAKEDMGLPPVTMTPGIPLLSGDSIRKLPKVSKGGRIKKKKKVIKYIKKYANGGTIRKPKRT